MLLLERVDFAANQLDLLNVARNWWLSSALCCNSGDSRQPTLAFIVDTALRLGLEFVSDVVEQLIQALAGAPLRAAHDAGRIVIHGDGWGARRRYEMAVVVMRWLLWDATRLLMSDSWPGWGSGTVAQQQRLEGADPGLQKARRVGMEGEVGG